MKPLTEDDFKFIMVAGWCERETMDYDENRFKQIKEQFLKSQEYIERVGIEHLEEIVINKVIVERLKRRIKELKKLLENKDLTNEQSMELQYWLRENTMALGEKNEILS